MTYGIRIWNEADYVQIDSQFRVLRFVEQGQITANAAYYFASPITTQEAPWIFIRPVETGKWFICMTVLGSPGNWTGLIIQGCNSYKDYITAGYLRRDRGTWKFLVGSWDMPAPAADSYGVALFDETGAPTYIDAVQHINLKFLFHGWKYWKSDQDNGVGYRYYTLDLPGDASMTDANNYLLINPFAVEDFNGEDSYAQGQNTSSRIIGMLDSSQLQLINIYGTKTAADFFQPGIIGRVSA